MRINSMKFSIIVLLISLICGIVACLFFIEIPPGNREVAYVLLGGVLTAMINAIADLFQKPKI